MWITCGYYVEKALKPYFIRWKMWITYSQNRTCKPLTSVHIILLQEDSMSGSYVLKVRRDVLSKC